MKPKMLSVPGKRKRCQLMGTSCGVNAVKLKSSVWAQLLCPVVDFFSVFEIETAKIQMSKVSRFRTAGFPATTSTWGGRAAERRALQPVWGGALCLRWPPYFCHWAGKCKPRVRLETILQSFKRRVFQTFKLLLYKISKCLSRNFIAHRRAGERDTIPNFKDQNLQMCGCVLWKHIKNWSWSRSFGPCFRTQSSTERRDHTWGCRPTWSGSQRCVGRHTWLFY